LKAPERAVYAVEFDVAACAPGDEPSGPALVAAAAAVGADRVVVHARATAEHWAVVHRDARVEVGGEPRLLAELTLAEVRGARAADGRVATLEETMLAAHRRGVGLVIRIHDGRVTAALAGALGVMAGSGPAALRTRYLVVVPDARIGKSLRRAAPDLPSARAIARAGGAWRGALARRFPNLARAAADADDLVVPGALATPERVERRLVPVLRRRGAFVWVDAVPPALRHDYALTGAGGILVDLPLPAAPP